MQRLIRFPFGLKVVFTTVGVFLACFTFAVLLLSPDNLVPSRLGAVVLVCFSGLFLLSWVIIRQVSSRLAEIAAEISGFREMNFQRPPKYRGENEIDPLAVALTETAESLNRYFLELREKILGLEAQIEQRSQYEYRLATLLDNIPDVAWLKDENGVYLMVNAAFAKVRGCPKEDIIGRADADLWPMDLANKFTAEDREVIESGIHRCIEDSISGPDGRQAWMETIKTPVYDSYGARTATVGISRDINDRKAIEEKLLTLNRELEDRVRNRTTELVAANERLTWEIRDREMTERELQENRRMLQTVFDGIAEPLLLLDSVLNIRMMNRTARAYYQLDDEMRVEGLQCHRLFKNKTTPCEGCRVPGAIEEGTPQIYERKGFMRPDQDERFAAYPIQNASGENDGCVIHIRDITEEKRMENELIQADKMISLGILVSGVAHEINNPNNWIMLNAPILLETWQSVLPILDAYYQKAGDFSAGGLPYQEMKDIVPRLLNGILGGSKRIMKIVNDLKDYARYQPGNAREPVDINKVIENAVSLLENQIRKSTGSFTIDYGQNLPMIQGDWQKLEQVVINLLQNACQSLPDSGKGIHISSFLDKQTGTVAVSVADEGIGIPETNLSRIIDPFFTTKGDIGGTGLGLSVSSKIVNDHGGRLSVDSREGHGATFTVYLPLEQRSEKVKVLVVDDDETIRLLATKILSSKGRYAVREAANGVEACLMLGTDTPELLILDINMPDMDGFEVCRQIRKTPSLLGLKVIVITGNIESPRVDAIRKMGFPNILQKPIMPTKLLQLADALIRGEPVHPPSKAERVHP